MVQIMMMVDLSTPAQLRRKVSSLLLINCGIVPWLLMVLKRIMIVRDTTPSWCIMRECGLEPLHFNCFWATVWLHNALNQRLHCKKDFICWHATELTVQWMLIIPHLVCHDWSDRILHAQRKAAEVWGRRPCLSCCGPQGQIFGWLGTSFCYASTKAQQQTLNFMLTSGFQTLPIFCFERF